MLEMLQYPNDKKSRNTMKEEAKKIENQNKQLKLLDQKSRKNSSREIFDEVEREKANYKP